VVDVDNDGIQDIVFVTDGGQIYALSGQGAVLDGFPKAMAAPSISGVAAGDIDGDGLYELVAVTWNGWAYAWNTQGVVAEGNSDWPMRGVDPRNTGIFRGAGGSTGVDPQAPMAVSLSVLANPSPGATEFLVPLETRGTLSVFDASGRLVSRIPAGTGGIVTWNPGAGDRNGVYFARLFCDSGAATVKFVLLR